MPNSKFTRLLGGFAIAVTFASATSVPTLLAQSLDDMVFYPTPLLPGEAAPAGFDSKLALALNPVADSQMVMPRADRSLFTDYQGHSIGFEDVDEVQRDFSMAVRQLSESKAFADPQLYALEQDLIKTFFINANPDLLGREQSYASLGEQGPIAVEGSTRDSQLDEYTQGVDAYLRIVGYLRQNPDATVQQLAGTMLSLADWHVMFGQYARASEQYRQVEMLFNQVKLDERQIESIMKPSVPAPLPTFLVTPFSSQPLPDASQYDGYVDITLNLDRYGRVGDVVMLDSSKGTSVDIEKHLVRLVRNTQFRPTAGRDTTPAIRYYYSWKG